MSSSFQSVFVLVSCNYSGSGRLCIRTSDMASLSDIYVGIYMFFLFTDNPLFVSGMFHGAST